MHVFLSYSDGRLKCMRVEEFIVMVGIIVYVFSSL